MKKQHHNLILHTVVGLGFIVSSMLVQPMVVRAQPLPRVVAFTVQARTNAQAPIFDYTVEFNSSSCLKTVELWRAPYEIGICDETTNACDWTAVPNPVKTISIPVGECDLSTGSINDTPPSGTFMYGAHVVDQTNNIGYEQSRIKITYTPSTVVTLIASDPNATEPSDNGTFTISRTGSTAASLSVGYNIAGTNASSATDFTLKQGTTVLGGGGSIVIPIGAVSAAVTVEVMDDAIAESPETVVLNLTPASPYTLATPTNATIVIADNDGSVTTCTDGTANNQCSTNKPKFCSNGTLIDKASQCGCPTGQTAQGDSCTSSSSCTATVSTGSTVTVRVTTTDPENDPLYYTVTWGDGASSRVPGSGTVASGFAATQTHVYNAPGTFSATAIATDVNGGVSPASDPLTVCVTGAPQCTPGASCSNVLQGQTCPGTYNNTCACVDTQDSCPGAQGTAGDLTCDSMVDVRDLGVLFHFWGKVTTVISACGTPLSSLGTGITLDAIVNDDDFAVLLANWGS